jgi:hypothetical protein
MAEIRPKNITAKAADNMDLVFITSSFKMRMPSHGLGPSQVFNVHVRAQSKLHGNYLSDLI